MEHEDRVKRITQYLQLTPQEIKEGVKTKQAKANELLSHFMAAGAQENAIILMTDKTLEVNGDISVADNIVFYQAIFKGYTNIVREALTNDNIKKSLKLNLKENHDKICQEIIQSNDTKIYDLIESLSDNPLKILSDSFKYSLAFGQLDLIKYLIDKTVEGQYCPIDFEKAIVGYSSTDRYRPDSRKELLEYASYFADIENKTTNTFIDSKTKESFFTTKLLTSIMYKKDEDTLNLYRQVVGAEQLVKDMGQIFKNQEVELEKNWGKITQAVRWCFLKNIEVDFKKSMHIKKIMNKNLDLKQYYEKLKLNEQFEEKFPQKENTVKEKKLKI